MREEDGALEISRLLPVSRAQLWRRSSVAGAMAVPEALDERGVGV
jgi:hypothetical protein